MTFRNVLITGASSGLGRGLTMYYANAGATVFAVARRETELRALATELSGAGRIVPVIVDVTNLDAQVAAIRAAENSAGGALDLVIANAGSNWSSPARKIDWTRVRDVFQLNATAACVTISAALPAMCARGSGTVVAMASLAAFRGLPAIAAYSASKAALHTFMESLRVDLRGTGVRALTIYPGFVKSELTARHNGPMPFLMEADRATEIMARGIARGRPMITFPWPMATAIRLVGALPRSIYEPLASAGTKRKRHPKSAEW